MNDYPFKKTNDQLDKELVRGIRSNKAGVNENNQSITLLLCDAVFLLLMWGALLTCTMEGPLVIHTWPRLPEP